VAMTEGAQDPDNAVPSAHPAGKPLFGQSNVHRSLAGKLLVSPPWMDDPTFARSVVLVLAHTQDGAFGVVLNDESTTGVDTIADVVGPAWAAMLAPPESIFVGGPCQTSSVIALAMVDLDGDEWEITVVDLNQDAPLPHIARIRLFAGYAGWAPLQLESELARNGWYVAEARVEDSMTDDPDALWTTIMERNGNPYARIPVDPTLN
jgi:putative transcriptional regulator